MTDPRKLNFPPAYPHDPRVQAGEPITNPATNSPQMKLEALRARAFRSGPITTELMDYIVALRGRIVQLESDAGWESSARHAERSGGTL